MIGYGVFDWFGGLFFSLARFLGILPRPQPFEAKAVRKILILRLDRLGDIVLSTPAIHAVRQRFPGARIDLMVSAYCREIVAGNPWVDRVLVYPQDSLNRDYDLAISLQPGLARNYLLFLSGARWRAGYRGWGGGFFLTNSIKDDRETRIRHEVDSALEVVGLFGCSLEDKVLDISLSPAGEEFAGNFYQEHNLKPPVVFIHPGSRQEYIRWIPGRFAALADKLIREKQASVVISGARGEAKLIQEVAAGMKEKAVIALGLSLAELVSALKKSNLFIGNSTGPMHIAAALRVPVVGIFGCRHPLDSYLEWGPWGKNCSVVFRDLSCGNCHPSDCSNFDCMKAISVEDVYQAAIKFLAVNAPENKKE